MWDGKVVGFISYLHFMHPIVKNMKRVHRLVVLPDYQGIGIGVRLLNSTAEHFKKLGFRVSLVTSTPALIHSLKDKWICKEIGRKKGGHNKTANKALAKTLSTNRITASFEYKNI